MNEYTDACRCNWSKGAKMKRETQDMIGWCIRATMVPRFEGKVDIRIVFREPNRRRDKDNVVSAQKFILDALQEVRIIKNDSWRYVDVRSDVVYAKDNPGVKVTIRETGKCQGTN